MSAVTAMKNMDEDLIDENVSDDDIVAPFRYTMSSYGAVFTVDELVEQLNQGDIYMPPREAEDHTWSLQQASRFIESLLLGFPTPTIFLAIGASRTRFVIDGQQRLRAVQTFFNGTFDNQPFALTGVESEFAGKTYRTLSFSDRQELCDTLLHAIVFEPLESSDTSQIALYQMFERLNTTKRPLSSQDIPYTFKRRLNL